MNRASLNLLIDVLAGATLTAMVITAFILEFALPPGTNRTLELWGISRHTFGRIHAIVSAGLLAVLALHVALHWRWLVTGVYKRLGLADPAHRHPLLAGSALLALAAVPVIGVAVASGLSVRESAKPRHAQTPSSGDHPLQVLTPPSPTDIRRSLTEAADAILIFRCARCHGTNLPDAGLRADSTAALSQIQPVLGGHTARNWLALTPDCVPAAIVPLRAKDHASQKMGKHELPSEELAILRAWAAAVASDSPPEQAGGSDAAPHPPYPGPNAVNRLERR